MVKLHSKTKDKTIPVREMEDGQIGIITQWGGIESVIGHIVQRYGENIVVLGERWSEGYSIITSDTDCRVRVLEKGELIEI